MSGSGLRSTGLGGAGLRLLPWTATLFLVAPRAGKLADRFGDRPLIAAGLFLQATGLAWIAVIASPGLAYPAMVPPMIIAGAGISMAMPAAQKSVVTAVGPGEIGKASGTFQTARQLGGAVGVAILVAVFAAAAATPRRGRSAAGSLPQSRSPPGSPWPGR